MAEHQNNRNDILLLNCLKMKVAAPPSTVYIKLVPRYIGKKADLGRDHAHISIHKYITGGVFDGAARAMHFFRHKSGVAGGRKRCATGPQLPTALGASRSDANSGITAKLSDG